MLIGVKAWQIVEVREDLNRILNNNTIIIPLQNGILASEELMETIDRKHILGGLCRIFSKLESSGIINHFGILPSVVFGELDKSKTERVNEIQSIFLAAGINSKISEDIEADLWRKFIAICTSGLLTVTKTTYGELRELQVTRQMLIDLLTEGFMLSLKIGIAIESDFVSKTLAFIDSFPYDTTTSLTRDVLENKPSEIEYQNGTIVRLGEKHGVETPLNKFIYNCILPNELKIRGIKFKNFRIVN